MLDSLWLLPLPFGVIGTLLLRSGYFVTYFGRKSKLRGELPFPLDFYSVLPYNHFVSMTGLTPQSFNEDLAPEDEELVRQMFEVGLHWGRNRSVTHPKMQPFIFSTKGEIEVIDLAKTLELLRNALLFVTELIRGGKTILLVGTQPAVAKAVGEVADRLGFPYVNERWLGGTLTNFKTILGRIAHWQELEAKINSPEFSEYTKKERLQFQEEVRMLQEKFSGLKPMTSPPGALLIMGTSRHETALREAKRRDIPVVAVVDTDDDPSAVAWPIPANDNTRAGISLLLEKFAETVEKARNAGEKEVVAAGQAAGAGGGNAPAAEGAE